MKLAGFLLLPAGWVIVLAAIALLRPTPAQAVFAVAGIAVEALGLSLAVHSHVIRRGRRT